MSNPIAPVAHDGVRAAIQRAADATGVDFSLLLETARRESSLNPSARARTSSATGLFQFIDSTWLDMIRRHGSQHGLRAEALALSSGADAPTRASILALRSDPEISARMAAELARENAEFLQSRLGRAPSPGEVYAAHVMGPNGALRLIDAAARGEADAAALFPREAAANRGLFYAEGEPRSARALLERLDLDATARAGAPQARAERFSGETPMSPALAQALFAIALLPLIRGGDDANSDPMRAISAYSQWKRD